MTDKEILDKIYSDNIKGFMVLADTYADIVYKMVCDILDIADQREIEECVCDSFIAFYNNIDDVDLSRGSIRGYLGVVARRRAINLYHTICPDDTADFDEYTVEEMSNMPEVEIAEKYAGLSGMIIKRCFREIAPEALEEMYDDEAEDEEEAEACDFADEAQDFADENEETYEDISDEPTEIIIEKTGTSGRVIKTLLGAFVLVSVITLAVLVLSSNKTPEHEPTTTQTTTQTEPFNPLFSAIAAGNEKLIEKLITNSLLLTEDVLRFAVEYADKISYDSIRKIAEEVKNKYGSTGLEPILEGAVFGDFKAVEDKLKNKVESEMTRAEKLAKYFLENFGKQVN